MSFISFLLNKTQASYQEQNKSLHLREIMSFISFLLNMTQASYQEQNNTNYRIQIFFLFQFIAFRQVAKSFSRIK